MIGRNSRRGLGQVVANLNEPMVDLSGQTPAPLAAYTSGQVVANLNQPLVDINQPLGQPLVNLTPASGSSASGSNATAGGGVPSQTLLLLGALVLLVLMVTRK